MFDDCLKISVVIPVYNGAKYIEQCLDSIILQTYENLEIICVNDGSTDQSGEILQKYADKDARIQIIYQQNQGLSAARNTGIEAATGDYISFVDADDYLTLDAYHKIASIIKNQERTIDILAFNGFMLYEYPVKSISFGLLILHDPSSWGDLTHSHFKNIKMWRGLNDWAAWNKIYRRSWLEANHLRFPVGLIYEDRLFNTQAFLATENIYAFEDFLYIYRKHRTSITGTNHDKIFDLLTIMDQVLQLYLDHSVFEYMKDAYFVSFMMDVVYAANRSSLEVFTRLAEEFKIRISRILIFFEPADLPKFQYYYRIYEDLTKLSAARFMKKYKNDT